MKQFLRNIFDARHSQSTDNLKNYLNARHSQSGGNLTNIFLEIFLTRDIYNQRVIWEIPRAFPAPSLSPLYTTHSHGVRRYWDIKADILLPQSFLIFFLITYIMLLTWYNICDQPIYWWEKKPLRNPRSVCQSWPLETKKIPVEFLTFWILQSVSNSENPWGLLLPLLPCPEFRISDVNHSNIDDLNKPKIKKQK